MGSISLTVDKLQSTNMKNLGFQDSNRGLLGEKREVQWPPSPFGSQIIVPDFQYGNVLAGSFKI